MIEKEIAPHQGLIFRIKGNNSDENKYRSKAGST